MLVKIIISLFTYLMLIKLFLEFIFQTDEFVLEAVDLKKIKSIKLGHDGANLGAGWFVDKVIIEDTSNSKYKETFDIQR